MVDNLTPARIVTPGRILQKELDARNWSQKEFAEIIERPSQMVSEIINGKKQITPDTAIQFSEALDISAEFWMNLETKYQLNLVKKKQQDREIKRRSRIYSLVPVSEITKRGWIEKWENVDELEKLVCDFLEIPSLAETPQVAVNYRCSESSNMLETSRVAWCKRVKQIVNSHKSNRIGNFKLENFRQALPSILECALKESDIQKIPNILNGIGIHIVVLPHLSKTRLDGAAFFIEDNPVIALTMRYDRVDNFWFTLLHELGHIFANHKGVFLDDMDKVENRPEETEANQLASKWLVDDNAFNSFVAEQKGKFSKKSVQEFAQSQNRHPGIIVGRLHYEKKIPFTHQRKYLVKVRYLLKNWSFE